MKNIELYHENLSEGDQLLIERIEAEAEKTPPKDGGLAVHVGAILKLRGKGYSYREIAEWFRERSIKCNHVDVWRAHKNSLPVKELFETAEHDPDWKEFVTEQKQGSKITFIEKDIEAEPDAQAASLGQPAPGLAKTPVETSKKNRKSKHGMRKGKK